MALTIIRHKKTVSGFCSVITNTAKFEAVFQMYSTYSNGCTTLDVEETYTTEALAIDRFNSIGGTE